MFIKRFLEENEVSESESERDTDAVNSENSLDIDIFMDGSSVLSLVSDSNLSNAISLETDCSNSQISSPVPILQNQNQNYPQDNCAEVFDSSPLSLTDDLKLWSLTQNVNHKQLKSLLSILKPYHPELPLDSRTLLNTERSLGITPMQSQNGTNGEYIYFGIQQNLEQQLFHGNLNRALKERNITSLELKCNVDGLKIHKSTNIDFWPILAAVHVPNLNTDPFVIAIYMGDSKPKSLEKFLNDFIAEIEYLSVTNIKGPSSILYTFSLKYLICDAPARAFLKNIKGHSGFYACERCVTKGEKINGRLIYRLNDNDEKRSHVSFINKTHAEHHLGPTPLTKLTNFNMIFGFPLDYMHMACLGVMRRLLNFWFKSDSEFRISPAFRREASARIVQIAAYTPREFSRRPRSFFELDRWKATEFRFFLLYIGVYVTKDLLSPSQYKNFVHFVCALRIVCSNDFLRTLGNTAVSLINKFCKDISSVYDEFVEPIFNTHSVAHLVQDAVEGKENPEDINCFMFENYLGRLKKMIRTPNKPLSQVCKRLAEKKDSIISLKNYDSFNNFSIVYMKCGKAIKAVTYKNLYIATFPKKDSYVLLFNKKIMSVNKIVVDNENNVLLYGSVFQITETIFRYSNIESTDLNMFKVRNLSSFQFSSALHEIVTKCIVFPYFDSDFMGAVGLLHVNY